MQVHDLAPLLNVADLERSLRFYRDVLGFSVVEDYALDDQLLWTAIQSGQAKLMLHQAPQSDPARSQRPSYADLVLYLYVEDAALMHAELEQAGFAPGPIEQEDVGLVEFYLRDPDGYEIGIGSPLPPWVQKGKR